jgi:hypothetical protein
MENYLSYMECHQEFEDVRGVPPLALIFLQCTSNLYFPFSPLGLSCLIYTLGIYALFLLPCVAGKVRSVPKLLLASLYRRAWLLYLVVLLSVPMLHLASNPHMFSLSMIWRVFLVDYILVCYCCWI